MKRKCFLCLFLLMLCMGTGITVYAAEESINKNKAEMLKDGTVKYTAYDTTASASVTWRTEGFTVKKERTKGDPTKAPKGEFMLADGEKESEEIAGGKTRTTFIFPEAKVRKQFDKAKIDGDSLEKSGGYVYLNGIFRVYEKGEVISGYKKTLYAIMHAAGWRNPDDFRDHFDIQLKYEAKPQPVYLTLMKYSSKGFSFVSREKIATIDERGNYKTDTSMIPGSIEGVKGTIYLYRTHWAKMSDPEKERSNGTYRTVRDKVKTTRNPKSEWDTYRESLKALRNRKYNVPYKGIEIVCVYKHFTQKAAAAAGEIAEDIVEPSARAVIQADNRGAEKFNSEEGIPTTEYQYVNAVTSEYLTQYRFKNYSGTKTYLKKIPGEIGEDGKPGPDTFEEVERSYSYWKIADLNVYKLSGADIDNDSLPGTTVHLNTSSTYKAPVVSYKINSSNMKEPSSGKEEIGQIQVCNDSLVFNGKTIMNGSWTETSTMSPSTLPAAGEIDENALYRSGLLIERDKANGEYESIGTVIYSRICHYGSDGEGSVLEYDIDDINNVIVHTPTVCDGKVEDVRKYNQMIQPNQSIAGIILDRSFSIELPTEGYHSELKGYAYRDYEKYIARREVRFPFDVYRGSAYCRANTWLSLTQDRTEFYLPVWVNEGEYTVEFRSRTINCDANDGLGLEEDLANTDYENYVAVDTADVEVSGRLYDLQLYDISDYPLWRNVFRNENSMKLTGRNYAVGTKNRNGSETGRNPLFTLPTVNGSHPDYHNVGIQKTGYVSRFYIKSIGNMDREMDYINVKPAFYFIDKAGNREEVDVYYTETFGGKRQQLVKAGSALDETNKKAMQLGNSYTSVPAEELSEKALLTGKTVKEIKAAKANVYTFMNVMIPEQLRTYIGRNYTPTGTVPAGVSAAKVSRSIQKWYFEYYLPSEIHICPKDYDVYGYAREHYGLDYKEDFWKKDGYLAVNFEIETIQNGKRHLSYINADNAASGYCNMWKLEGYQYTKTDNTGRKFYFKDGDTILYYPDKSAAKDYTSSGTH